jgi:hypothetical protein
MRFRLAVVAALAGSLAALLCAGQARAAAEVHRLSLMISGIPSQVQGGDFNDYIDRYNATRLEVPTRAYEGLPHIAFTWVFDGELRYFVRPNFAVTAGVSQIRVGQKKEYLPAISQGITVRGEILSVPIHVGGAYYAQPYNQGDFQARAYVGGGLMQYTYSRATFEQVLTAPDSALVAGFPPGSFKQVLTQDAPGYYLEGGAHMFFAARWSMMVGVIYRSGILRDTRLESYYVNGQRQPGQNPGAVQVNSKGKPYVLDMSGVGAKLALGIGF